MCLFVEEGRREEAGGDDVDPRVRAAAYSALSLGKQPESWKLCSCVLQIPAEIPRIIRAGWKVPSCFPIQRQHGRDGSVLPQIVLLAGSMLEPVTALLVLPYQHDHLPLHPFRGVQLTD